MNKTVSSVIDDINEWQGPHGTVYYVTCFFTDETVGSVGRKDHDAALEVQGLLREAIGQEQDFELDPNGKTKGGREKFRVLGFGTPGGAATYTAPGVQGGGTASASGGGAPGRGRSPEQDVSIRASVAIKAAVELGGDINTVFENADAINAWLIEKSSEPASSAYPQVEDDSPRTPMQPAGAGSEDRGVGVGEATDVAESLGEGTPASTPPVAHDVQHTHDWQLRQGVRGFLVCDCGATRKKETVP